MLWLFTTLWEKKTSSRDSLHSKIFFYMCEYFAYILCLCTTCVPVPMETRRGHQIPWSSSYN